MKYKKTPLDAAYKEIKGLKNIDEMFDLLIFSAFVRGQFNGMVPVDESREIFEEIKKRIRSECKSIVDIAS